VSVAVRERVEGGRRARLTEPRSIAVIGIVLGLLGLWSALPPWTFDAIGVPLAFGIGGAAAGLWALTRGERRIGLWAIGVAVGATAAALWVQGRDDATLEAVFNTGLVAATLRYATPLAFAAIGGIFSERSGVVNIGLEGMMLAGAFFGIWASAWSGSWIVGLLVALLAGGLLALLHAIFSITLRADQIVSGTAVNFLALGLTGYLFRSIYGSEGTPSDISRVPALLIPGLEEVPFLGDVLGRLSLMVWLMFLLLLVSWVVLFRTAIGLRLRSVGEHPKAADTVGISVYRVRYAAVVVSGMLAALGGAYLSIGFVGSFNENMTAGRGFIALAAVIFGAWRPLGAFAGCLLFGCASALAQRLQSEADVSANLLSTLPYVLTLVALVGLIGRSRPPAAIGRPYVKG
jgi:general nucleoside transport system permease protein